MLSFEAARARIVEIVSARAAAPASETLNLVSNSPAAFGRVIAKNIIADRNYPPFDRSVRDGYALRSADAAEPGARLRLIGESRAGVGFSGTVETGQCVRIFTGAPLPRGANTVAIAPFPIPMMGPVSAIGGVVGQPLRFFYWYLLCSFSVNLPLMRIFGIGMSDS